MHSQWTTIYRKNDGLWVGATQLCVNHSAPPHPSSHVIIEALLVFGVIHVTQKRSALVLIIEPWYILRYSTLFLSFLRRYCLGRCVFKVLTELAGYHAKSKRYMQCQTSARHNFVSKKHEPCLHLTSSDVECWRTRKSNWVDSDGRCSKNFSVEEDTTAYSERFRNLYQYKVTEDPWIDIA